ncbi:MAG: sulfatase-like hydrolase/transferase [Provencibacterium sp.]|jgi:choline-sulfatase|nr:sulfatase-like hydrolase/transferase [Provencibacterium sp.]
MKPNIILLILDQVTWRALPAYGNTFARTPHLDRLAAGGLAIDGCYTPYPLCQPARAAFWTGRYPHETHVLSNGGSWRKDGSLPPFPTLGEVFSAAGYETVHFGKTHDGGTLRGFACAPEEQTVSAPVHPAYPQNQDTFRDNYTVQAIGRYLQQRTDERPLLLAADIINPHNICGWVGENQGVHPSVDSGDPLPPLPENFEFPDIAGRPRAVQYACCTNNRQAQAAGWTPENFREYLRAYYHYLSLADRAAGQVLDALEAQGFTPQNSLFVLMADHGDNMAARGRVNKQVDFYEETTRVPLIFKGPGVLPGKKSGLVSLLDLFPTLCGWAGIPAPEGLQGRDLSPALSGGALPDREYVASEWHTEWGYTVSPGRMIRTERYKYTRYIEGAGEELFDLEEDPGEQKNLAQDPSAAGVLEEMRALLQKHLRQTEDNFASLEWVADTRWRSHPVGYQNHRGIAAPMTGKEH